MALSSSLQITTKQLAEKQKQKDNPLVDDSRSFDDLNPRINFHYIKKDVNFYAQGHSTLSKT